MIAREGAKCQDGERGRNGPNKNAFVGLCAEQIGCRKDCPAVGAKRK
jgi:hypothetical protein